MIHFILVHIWAMMFLHISLLFLEILNAFALPGGQKNYMPCNILKASSGFLNAICLMQSTFL